MTEFELVQPGAVTPEERGDDDCPDPDSWAIYGHADGSLSLHLYCSRLEATDHLPAIAAHYGMLLLGLAASKRRTAKELVIGFHEANVYTNDLGKLKTPPAFVPVRLPPIDQGVDGILGMAWEDVVIGRRDAA